MKGYGLKFFYSTTDDRMELACDKVSLRAEKRAITAQSEIKAMAIRARRSIAQRVRRAVERVGK